MSHEDFSFLLKIHMNAESNVLVVTVMSCKSFVDDYFLDPIG